MKQRTRKRFEEAGARFTTAGEFLGLSPAEIALIDMRIALARQLREQRGRAGLTQLETARRIGSSQSRLAKMEAADPSVSIDLLIRSLLSLGASRRSIARAVSTDRLPSGSGRRVAVRAAPQAASKTAIAKASSAR